MFIIQTSNGTLLFYKNDKKLVLKYFDIKTFKILTFPSIITNIMHCIKVDYLTRHWFNFVQEIGLRAKYVKGAFDGNLIRIWDVWVFIIQCMSDNIYKFFRRWHSEATSRTTLLSNRKERLILKEDASIIIFHQHHLTSNVCHYHVPRSMVIRWKVSIYLDIEYKSSKVADHISIDDTTILFVEKNTFLKVAQHIQTTRLLITRQENTKKQYFFLHI